MYRSGTASGAHDELRVVREATAEPSLVRHAGMWPDAPFTRAYGAMSTVVRCSAARSPTLQVAARESASVPSAGACEQLGSMRSVVEESARRWVVERWTHLDEDCTAEGQSWLRQMQILPCSCGTPGGDG